MASLRSGHDRLLASPCTGCSIAANHVPVCVNFLPKKYQCSSIQTNEFGAFQRILSRPGRAGVARVSKLRVECSGMQTVVSVEATEEPEIVCEACRGLGFRICDYCEGEKVNVPVKGRTNRFHRRCPECKAVGIMMCYRCKVFKCVTFPDWDDGSFEKKR